MTAKLSKAGFDTAPSPVALASALAVATDEIREQFRPPANTLFLHPKQMEVHKSRCRFKVVVAGRRWGKTRLALVSLIKFARIPRRLIWYVAPSYRMAKQIMWPDLVEAIPRSWVRKYNETILTITLVNGSRIELKGADNPDTLRGVGIHYLVMDEVQDISPDAWKKVLRPTLASTGGHALFIGTPKSYNVLHELWSAGQNEDAKAWASWQFPTITSPFIPAEEIEAARADMDEKSFEQEFNASFTTMSGRVYYPFDRKLHVKPLTFDPALPIWIGQDFNIDPMSSVVFQRQKNGDLWAVDEICLMNSNTQELCDELERRYWRFLEQIVILSLIHI